MKKYILLFAILLFGFLKPALAMHIKGGWIQYEYLSTDVAKNTNKYRITVRQYISCTSGVPSDPDVYLGIFDGQTNAFVQVKTIAKTSSSKPSITTFDPCIKPIPKKGDVCYIIDVYTTTIDLPINQNGYTLAVQRCCRIAGIVNVLNSDQYGITYSNKIPGTIGGVNYGSNNSPSFIMHDTVIICHNTPFNYDFSASDVDSDSLAYFLCDGFHGGANDPSDANAAKPNPPSKPPYTILNYTGGFSGSSPMGIDVTINSKTGLLSGIAPDATGEYVVAVCAYEYRKGVLIGITKKEIHINVANCKLSAADLKPSYITCDGYTLDFENLSDATNITSYMWYFGDDSTSTNPKPQHTYPHPPDTATYTLKLVVKSFGCTDSDSALVKIYPGFKPDFTVDGSCFQNKFTFTNTTFARYGFVDSMHWDFGDVTTISDTSLQKIADYKYATAGKRTVLLYAHSSKGCEDTISKVITVLDKPSITLPFRDTLICSIDTLPLLSSSNGVTYSWSPNINISNTSIPNPYVFPKDTVHYILTVTDRGCINKDSIKVNVLDFITVDAGVNSNVCLTDTFKMQPISYALGYEWSVATDFINPLVKNALVIPKQKVNKYYVKANLGKCQDNDSITLFTFPYPVAKVSNDTSICLGQSVKLKGDTIGNIFKWSPANSLTDTNTLTPTAKPNITTKYTLTTRYLTGCLKPRSATVEVHVVQPFTVFAGRDTSVVVGQPLQLFGLVDDASDKKFTWTSIPVSPTYLDNATIQNPIAILPAKATNYIYKVRAYTKEDCFAIDDIKVTVFKTDPDIFVPSAFTPTGLNSVIRPTPVGFSNLEYFSIYNRFGQLLFTTSQIGKGWDGRVNGVLQDAGTFVYVAKGTDYLGKSVTKKGTVVLIR